MQAEQDALAAGEERVAPVGDMPERRWREGSSARGTRRRDLFGRRSKPQFLSRQPKELAEAFAIVETGRSGAVFPAADAQVGGAQHARHLGLRPMPLFPLPSQLDIGDGVRTCFHAAGFSDDIEMIYP